MEIRKISLLIMATSIFVLGKISVQASVTDANGNTVPDYMAPGTVLVYDIDLNPVIMKEGINTQKVSDLDQKERLVIFEPTVNSTNEEKIQIEKENEMSVQAYKHFLAGEYIQEPLPSVYSGMKVEYDNKTGVINNIYYVDQEEPSGYSIHNMPQNDNQLQKELSGSSDFVQWTWGKHNNILYYQKSDDAFIGIGRATYFTGQKGNRDNILKDRDCATKQAYDYSKKGDKDLMVRNLEKGTSYIFYQADVGTLPDAIIDIWGVANLEILAGQINVTEVTNVRYYHKRFSDQNIPN